MYQSAEEYYEELIGLVKKELDLYTRYAVRIREDGGIRHIYNTRIFKEELSNVLDDDFVDMDRDEYNIERRMLSIEWKVFHKTAYQSMAAGVEIPFERLLRKFFLTEFEKHCVCLAFAPELNREFERMYCYLQDDYLLKYPTLDLCIKMFSMDTFVQKKLIHQVFERKDMLKCIFQSGSNGQESELSWRLKLRKDMIQYVFLQEADLLNREGQYYLKVSTDEQEEILNVNKHVENRLKECLQKEGEKRIFILEGMPGSGKKKQVQLVAQSQNHNVLFFDLREMRYKNPEQRKESILDIAGRAILDDAYICFCHLEALREDEEWDTTLINEILREASFLFHTVFVTTQVAYYPEESQPYGCQIEHFEMVNPGMGQRIELWKTFFADDLLDDQVRIEMLAAQFDFTPGVMKDAANSAKKKAEAQGKDKIEMSHIHEACQQKVAHRLGERASRVKGIYTWDELILEEEQKDLLRQACNQISYRYRVYEEWGFQNKMAYGRGVSMVFAGPPGTGKTMAAQVLSKELGLELYKVDLSGVLSKYIGETQKNLREIFDEVQKSRSILFFDEADVLFSKRVNVSDARDISANSQTAYLLQKMEEYDGITILATNLMQNFDDAYKRRMKYIITFTLPQEDQRIELWENVFPKEMPLSNDIDIEYLAWNFELSGASIKNIALNAAFMAAADNEVMGMKYIIKALQQEYKKAGKILGKEELKEYHFYLK